MATVGKARDFVRGFLALEIRPSLKAKGFRQHSQSFCKWVGPNCEVVDFFGDYMRSTRERYAFFVELGLFNRRIFEAKKESDPLGELPSYPKAYDCHWRERLPALLPERKPEGWSIPITGPPAGPGAEIREGLERYALPLMERSVTDEGLRSLLLNEWQEGRLMLPEIIDLAALLAQIGPVDEFERVLGACRNDVSKKLFATVAKARIKKLGRIRRIPRR